MRERVRAPLLLLVGAVMLAGAPPEAVAQVACGPTWYGWVSCSDSTTVYSGGSSGSTTGGQSYDPSSHLYQQGSGGTYYYDTRTTGSIGGSSGGSSTVMCPDGSPAPGGKVELCPVAPTPTTPTPAPEPTPDPTSCPADSAAPAAVAAAVPKRPTQAQVAQSVPPQPFRADPVYINDPSVPLVNLEQYNSQIDRNFGQLESGAMPTGADGIFTTTRGSAVPSGFIEGPRPTTPVPQVSAPRAPSAAPRAIGAGAPRPISVLSRAVPVVAALSVGLDLFGFAEYVEVGKVDPLQAWAFADPGGLIALGDAIIKECKNLGAN